MANTNIAAILDLVFQQITRSPQHGTQLDPEIVHRIELIARNSQNRACARFIMACALAKVANPDVDIRKPYTEINSADAFSGRTYDESYISHFIIQHELPCNFTTAFLTPAFRNRNQTMTTDINLVGRPENVYKATLQLLDDVYKGNITSINLLVEMIRQLIVVRDEKRSRMSTLLAGLAITRGEITLSAEEIVNLVEQHLKLKRSSRLPVLIVAAAYQAAQHYLGERPLPLQGHHTADKQTGSLGDLEIAVVDQQQVLTSYEMKTRRIIKSDIDHALEKIMHHDLSIQNYIFITTEPIDPEVNAYAVAVYEKAGVEMVILDCIAFLRHFLHLFYRQRMYFLEKYQELLLAEPESSVAQPLKEAFLALRQAAESQ